MNLPMPSLKFQDIGKDERVLLAGEFKKPFREKKKRKKEYLYGKPYLSLHMALSRLKKVTCPV